MLSRLLYLLLLLAATAVYTQAQNFVKVTDTLNPIVNYIPTGKFNGAAWVDIDADGDEDLFASPDKLFRNEGSGVFSEIPTVIGFNNSQLPTGTSWADYDNDGDLDCYVAANPSRLYANDGTGQFTEIGSVPLASLDYAAWAAAFGDYDNDGFVDIVLAHPAGFLGPEYPSFLFQSDGSGGFTRNENHEFCDSTTLGPYTVPFWVDFDRDGDQDLFIASGPGGVADFDFCYRNLLVETGVPDFERISDLSFAQDMQDGQCYNFVDIDNDRDLDLFITNWTGAPNRLYTNDGGVYVQEDKGLLQSEAALSNGWGDFDNDGDLDVIVTNNLFHSTHLYTNDGTGNFTELLWMFPDTLHTSGMSIGDYDNDGDLDVFLGGNETGKALYRNNGIAGVNNFLSLELEGTVSNRSAIGAWVEMKCTINGQAVWQQRDLLAQNTASGQNSLRIHFGMGDAALADSVIIHWPSGLEEVYTGLFPRVFYQLKEGEGLSTGLPVVFNSTQIQIYPQPATNLINLQLPAHFSVYNQEDISLEVYDMSGRLLIEEQYQGRLHTEMLEAGLYNLVLSSPDGQFSTVFVIQ